ncbi:SRPBCC domain-containing protein [Bacillus sp. Marseille-Q3570]|uniref:SRPBCC family protein n=1 Tax=Bacillus sp. Marseille-Q3570 TaxID=2963522 RepID=UPI0021B7A5B1|nr:SRPBCC domain-containing protein [Bacillus sp. Marseille-Q3570]
MSTQVKITHTFNAPRELVFKAFTESEHLQNWWGPKGWTFNVYKSDFRAGGVFHYSQKTADGDEMWVKFVYREIIVPEKIVYTSFFSDEEGNIVRAPFNADWPLETLNSMTFIEDEGKTTVTAIVTPLSATEGELKTFEESQDMVHEGFSGTFNQLENYLSEESEANLW